MRATGCQTCNSASATGNPAAQKTIEPTASELPTTILLSNAEAEPNPVDSVMFIQFFENHAEIDLTWA